MALKVYRTPIGFHDAYVAAPSQKAALAAWGADANLFARGVAEVVTDRALTREPLAHPGEVIRVPRGTAEEHLAATPAKVARKPTRAAKPAKAAKLANVAKPSAPRPDRAEVDAAEAALAAADTEHRDAERALVAEEAALADRRRAMRAGWIAERDTLEAARDKAEAAYDAAMMEWRKV